MALGETESCGSRSASPPHPRQQRHKLEAYNEVLRLLRDSGHPECLSPSFEDELWAHFHRLPAWYALEVNVERPEHVLTHKQLLRQALDPASRAVFDVRLVQRIPARDWDQADFFNSNLQGQEHAQNTSSCLRKRSIHPPPAFGSSANLEALALEGQRSSSQDSDSDANATSLFSRPMHEITFSTYDKPKVLSQLTTLLAEIGLNIQEAHVFSTNDGFSLDVFVVDGWPYEETEQLKEMLQKKVQKIENEASSKSFLWPPVSDHPEAGEENLPKHVHIPTDETDVWEIDLRKLKFGKKVASGSYGDLYQGTYCSQDVAIKVLNPERVSVDMQREFAQEVYILRPKVKPLDFLYWIFS